jgi:GT2 family glycosyltransferase
MSAETSKSRMGGNMATVTGAVLGAGALVFWPSFLVLAGGMGRWTGALTVIGLGAALSCFWVFAGYHLVTGFYSLALRRYEHGGEKVAMETPARVAVLLATRNDFRADVAEGLAALEWPGLVLLVCDDSPPEAMEARQRVDAFAAQPRSSEVRVLRREGRTGYKAGNLNAALRQLGEEFDYFIVADADGTLPVDFIPRALAAMQQGSADGERVAFVQARQEAEEAQPGTVAWALGPLVGAHFCWQVRARAEEGFAMFYGHGALISMEAWRAAGGFPEIATEDLAFSMELRRLGWRGVYADGIVCQEEVPPTIARYGRRTEKWIRGTAECWRRHGWAFLRAGHIPWREKADAFATAAFHFLPLAGLAYFLLLAWPFPLAMASLHAARGGLPQPAPPDATEWWYRVRTGLSGGWELPEWMLLEMLLLLGGSLVLWATWLAGGKGRALRGLAAYLLTVTLWLGSLVRDSMAVLAYLFTGRAPFPVTGEETKGMRPAGCVAESRWVQLLTLVFAAFMLVASWRWSHLWLGAPGVASLWVVLRSGVARLRWWDWCWVAIPGLLGGASLAVKSCG